MSRLSIEGLVTLGRGPFDLTVEEGECVSLRGESGAGKTLFLRAVADLDAHEGTVLLDGIDARRMSGPSWRARVGLLFAESAWWSERVRDHFVAEAGELEAFGLPPHALDFEIVRLSTGERQRLAISRLLSIRPHALLLDEPTASLDEANVARAEDVLRVYREEKGAAVVWVTHDPRQAARVASRHFELVGGALKEVAL